MKNGMIGLALLSVCGMLFVASIVAGGANTVKARAMDVRALEAERARVEAEMQPATIRAEYDGQAHLLLVQGQTERDRDLTEAMILLATEDANRRGEWRVFAQLAALLFVAVGTAVGVMLYGRRVADALRASTASSPVDENAGSLVGKG